MEEECCGGNFSESLLNNKGQQTNSKAPLKSGSGGERDGKFRSLFLEVGGEPLKTLVETVTAGGAGGLDVPVALAEGVKSELVSDLSGVHGVGQILLVGEHQEEGVPELVLVEHAVKLIAGLSNTLAIV